jgi:hypothetical protein
MKITPTTPLRLAEALQVAFPHGGMTVSGLRLEAARGRLKIERIAGKDFTTLAAIEEMRALCVVPRTAAAKPPSPAGSRTSVAKEAFMAKLNARKARGSA